MAKTFHQRRIQDRVRHWKARGLLWFLTFKLAWLCAGQAAGPFPLYGYYSIHDPGTLIKNGSSYFIYGDGQGISGLTSTSVSSLTSTQVDGLTTTAFAAMSTTQLGGFLTSTQVSGLDNAQVTMLTSTTTVLNYMSADAQTEVWALY